MFENIKKIIDSVLEEFKSGNIPELISYVKFPRFDIPCRKWSLMNQLLVRVNHTQDARGFRQWEQVKRRVKKGSKSFKILVPCFKKQEKENGEEVNLLTFFKEASVFRLEDTEGEELNYPKLELPTFPLLERAKEFGLDVSAVEGNDRYYGSYSSVNKSIKLATPQEKVFFHELAHYADEQCNGKLKAGQEPLQEIVAELTAEVLTRAVGIQPLSTGNSYRYIESYAKELNLTPHTACIKIISRVDKALNLILKGEKIEELSSY